MNVEDIDKLKVVDGNFTWRTEQGPNVKYGTTKNGLKRSLKSPKSKFYGSTVFIMEGVWVQAKELLK